MALSKGTSRANTFSFSVYLDHLRITKNEKVYRIVMDSPYIKAISESKRLPDTVEHIAFEWICSVVVLYELYMKNPTRLYFTSLNNLQDDYTKITREICSFYGLEVCEEKMKSLENVYDFYSKNDFQNKIISGKYTFAFDHSQYRFILVEDKIDGFRETYPREMIVAEIFYKNVLSSDPYIENAVHTILQMIK